MASLKIWQRVLYVLPTGAGKTVILGWLVQQWRHAGLRVVYLVHTTELVEQTYRVLTSGYGLTSKDVGVIRGDDKRTNPKAPVQIATVQTLRLRTPYPIADVVVVDEAHHGVAQTWAQILSWYGHAMIIGVTATPERLDETPLGRCFQHMLQGPDVEALIESGWLRKPRCFVAARVNSRGERVHFARGKALAGSVRKTLLERAQGRSGIVFASGIRHAQRLVEELGTGAGRFATKLITGASRESERRKILDPGGWLDRGERRLVITCDVLNEGYDLPSVKLAVLTRHTHSLAVYLHQVGRIMRPHRTGDGAEWSPMVLDHAGNVLTFGVPWESRTWSLHRGGTSGAVDGAEAVSGSAAGPGGHAPPRAKACPACCEAAPVAATHCACGYEFPGRIPKERHELELREMQPATAEQRLAFQQAWHAKSLARQIESGMDEVTAAALAAEFAKKATRMWFGEDVSL